MISGILYVLAASSSNGAARRQSGHSKSSKTTMATCVPLGGRSTGFTGSWASATIAENIVRATTRQFLLINWNPKDSGKSPVVLMVTEFRKECQLREFREAATVAVPEPRASL